MKTFNESDHAEAIQAADEAGIDTILLSFETDSAPYYVITTKFFKESHSHKANPPAPQWEWATFQSFEAAQEFVTYMRRLFIFTTRTPECPEWLDKAIKEANLNGVDSIPEADSKDAGPFYVLITKSIYSRPTPITYAAHLKNKALAFDTFAEASACVKENSSFSDYKIVSEQSCNFNLE